MTREMQRLAMRQASVMWPLFMRAAEQCRENDVSMALAWHRLAEAMERLRDETEAEGPLAEYIRPPATMAGPTPVPLMNRGTAVALFDELARRSHAERARYTS